MYPLPPPSMCIHVHDSICPYSTHTFEKIHWGSPRAKLAIQLKVIVSETQSFDGLCFKGQTMALYLENSVYVLIYWHH